MVVANPCVTPPGSTPHSGQQRPHLQQAVRAQDVDVAPLDDGAHRGVTERRGGLVKQRPRGLRRQRVRHGTRHGLSARARLLRVPAHTHTGA